MTAAVLRLASMAWWFAAGLWFAAIVTAGVAAMSVFPNLRELEPSLPGWPVDEALHWRYAAGIVMEQVFFTADLMQFVAAPLALIATGMQAWVDPARRRRPSFLLRIATIVIAAASFGWYAAAVAPEMNGLLRAQWDAARAGDVATAEARRESFDALHHTADGLFRVILLAVSAAAMAAAFEAGRPTPPRPDDPAPAPDLGSGRPLR